MFQELSIFSFIIVFVMSFPRNLQEALASTELKMVVIAAICHGGVAGGVTGVAADLVTLVTGDILAVEGGTLEGADKCTMGTCLTMA